MPNRLQETGDAMQKTGCAMQQAGCSITLLVLFIPALWLLWQLIAG